MQKSNGKKTKGSQEDSFKKYNISILRKEHYYTYYFKIILKHIELRILAYRLERVRPSGMFLSH